MSCRRCLIAPANEACPLIGDGPVYVPLKRSIQQSVLNRNEQQAAGLMQAGCDVNTRIRSSVGSPHRCWVEYYPAPATYIGLHPASGQRIAVGVKAVTATSGFIEMKNLDTGEIFSTSLNAPTPSKTVLAASNVANFFLETTPLPKLPEFHPSVQFNNVEVFNRDGWLLPLDRVSSFEVRRAGKAQTNTTWTEHGVIIDYVE